MKLHNNSAYLLPRLATQAYGEQERRFESVQPQKHRDAESQAAQPPATSRSFSINLGKFGLRYEEQEPEIDTQQLARMALDRVRREQDARFRSEMEVEKLREAISASAPAEGSEIEDATASEPSGHLRLMASRAYAQQERSFRSAHYRPGVFIGAV